MEIIHKNLANIVTIKLHLFCLNWQHVGTEQISIAVYNNSSSHKIFKANYCSFSLISASELDRDVKKSPKIYLFGFKNHQNIRFFVLRRSCGRYIDIFENCYTLLA